MNRGVNTLADLPFRIAERFPRRAVLHRCCCGGILEMSGGELFEQILDVSLGLSECSMRRATSQSQTAKRTSS